MSHSDHIEKIPQNFSKIAHSSSSIAAIVNKKNNIYGVQFHPEVTHTAIGKQILSNFVINISKCNKN